MVKENWSLTKEQDNNIETEIIKQTNKTNSSHNDVGSVIHSLIDSKIFHFFHLNNPLYN